jgi:hypothetical protein
MPSFEMPWTDSECGVLFAFVRRRIGEGGTSLALDHEGGNTAAPTGVGEPCPDLCRLRFQAAAQPVDVKRLEGRPSREVEVYGRLAASPADALLPGLLGVERTGGNCRLLFLERVRAARRWPWAKPEWIARVLEGLAELHAALPGEDLSLGVVGL